jgi:hypothetical protein
MTTRVPNRCHDLGVDPSHPRQSSYRGAPTHMNFRRSITAVGAFALIGFALPVMVASPSEAAPCSILSPCTEPGTKIDAASGTPLDAGPFAETSKRTATFNIGVDPADTNVTYECKLEKDTTIVSDWTACTTPVAQGQQTTVGSVTYSGLALGGYKFSARATREADIPAAANQDHRRQPRRLRLGRHQGSCRPGRRGPGHRPGQRPCFLADPELVLRRHPGHLRGGPGRGRVQARRPCRHQPVQPRPVELLRPHRR